MPPKHPKNRAERLKLRETKKKQETGASKVRRRAKNELREKEAEDETKLLYVEK